MNYDERPAHIILTDKVTPLPEPIKPKPWYQRFARRLIAFVFAVAVLFLFGGFYHFGLLQQTPADVPAGEYNSKIAQATSSIPTTVFVLSDKNTTTTTSVQRLVDKTNAILTQVKVQLKPVRIESIATSTRSAGIRVAHSPEQLRRKLPDLRQGRLHVVLTTGLGGINGVAFPGRQVVAVAEYTTSFDFRVLAHEVGHILSLDHVNDKSNLMYSGSSGVHVTTQQAQEMYAASQDFYRKK